jgi:hypothetical protein
MNDQANTESAPNEGAGVPTPVSPASGQPSSAVATEALSLQELAKRLERMERVEQSGKDRAIDGLRKEFLAKLDEVSGKPVAEPATTAKVDTGTIGGAQAIPEALARFTEVGLSVSDPEVASLIGKSNEYKSRSDFLLEAERVINRKLIKPSVSAAAVVAPPAGAPQAPNAQELAGEYINKVMANRGNKAMIRQLQDEYKKKGVNVEKIEFTVK